MVHHRLPSRSKDSTGGGGADVGGDAAVAGVGGAGGVVGVDRSSDEGGTGSVWDGWSESSLV